MNASFLPSIFNSPELIACSTVFSLSCIASSAALESDPCVGLIHRLLGVVEHRILDHQRVLLLEVGEVHVERDLLPGGIRTIQPDGEIFEQHLWRHRPDRIRAGCIDPAGLGTPLRSSKAPCKYTERHGPDSA